MAMASWYVLVVAAQATSCLTDRFPKQFEEHLIKDRVEGGKRAAYALRAAVAKHVGERAGELEIVARVVANVTGLGKAMVRDLSVDTSNDFKDFTLGFTQAKASFDFIDVGYGKERADSKIKGVYQGSYSEMAVIQSPTCRRCPSMRGIGMLTQNCRNHPMAFAEPQL